MHAFPVPARFLFTYPCPHCTNQVSPLPEALTLWTQHPTVLLSTAQLPYTAHNFCECSPHFLSPPLKIQLQLVVCNVCQTQTPFSQTTTAALSVGRPSTYTHVCNKHQCCYLSIFTLLSLFWNEKKIWGITFWATFVYIYTTSKFMHF
jgi:hypothetical protein